MELRVKALASGSSGNAYLLQAGSTALLVDAGRPARILERCLRDQGVGPGALAGILLSHEHTDHTQGAIPLARRYGAPLVANAKTLASLGLGSPTARGALREQASAYAASAQLSGLDTAPQEEQAAGPPPLTQALVTGRGGQVGPFHVTSFRVPHDASDPVGYLIEYDGWSVCVATDLGEASASLYEPLRQADLVILEANHDAVRLRNGYYPAALKRRIGGREGHLSNDQAAEILVEACRSLAPQALKTVWLAHLSAHNNTQQGALQTVEEALCGARLRRHIASLEVARRTVPSLEWRAQVVQRSLF